VIGIAGKRVGVAAGKFRDLRTQLEKGITPRPAMPAIPSGRPPKPGSPGGWTGRTAKTITRNQNVLKLVPKVISARKLREPAAAATVGAYQYESC
jgi:hypothetical protein